LLTDGWPHPGPSAGLATWSAGAEPARSAGVRRCCPASFGLSGCAAVAGEPLRRQRLAAPASASLPETARWLRGAPATAVPRSARPAAAAVTPAACAGPGRAPAATGPTPLGGSCVILVNWPGLPAALSVPAPARRRRSAGPEAAAAA